MRFSRARTSSQAPLLPGTSSSLIFALTRCTLCLDGLAPRYQRPPLGRWRGPGIVNLYGWGRADPAGRAGHTEGHAIWATPLTSAQVWKAWARAARYWAAGRR